MTAREECDLLLVEIEANAITNDEWDSVITVPTNLQEYFETDLTILRSREIPYEAINRLLALATARGVLISNSDDDNRVSCNLIYQAIDVNMITDAEWDQVIVKPTSEEWYFNTCLWILQNLRSNVDTSIDRLISLASSRGYNLTGQEVEKDSNILIGITLDE